MTHQPLSRIDLDEITTRAAHLYEYVTVADPNGQAALDELAGTDVPALLAEVRRLRQQNRILFRSLAIKSAKSGDADRALAAFLAADDPEFVGTRPCGHDDYHDPHEWHGRPGTWCPGISTTDDEGTGR